MVDWCWTNIEHGGYGYGGYAFSPQPPIIPFYGGTHKAGAGGGGRWRSPLIFLFALHCSRFLVVISVYVCWDCVFLFFVFIGVRAIDYVFFQFLACIIFCVSCCLFVQLFCCFYSLSLSTVVGGGPICFCSTVVDSGCFFLRRSWTAAAGAGRWHFCSL